jgi:hypothetical protein
VELLKSEEAACTVARLEHVLIPSLAAAMRMANALDGHLTLATLVLEGCGLGSYTFEDLQNSRVKRIGSAGASRMNLATEPSRGSILADRGNGKLLEALATALSRCRALASLNLNSNAITDRDITSIARLSKLQTLGLGHNEISDSGAAMLGDALPLFNNLRVLDVSRNKIGDAGMTALCAGLTSGGKTPLKLQVLRVEYNRFRKEGWNAISAMLPTAAALTLLDVSGNTLTTLNDVANRFTGALQQCPSLSVLGVNSMRSDVALTHAERIEGGTFYDEAAEQKAVVIDISQTRIADALPAVLEPMLVRNHLTGKSWQPARARRGASHAETSARCSAQRVQQPHLAQRHEGAVPRALLLPVGHHAQRGVERHSRPRRARAHQGAACAKLPHHRPRRVVQPNQRRRDRQAGAHLAEERARHAHQAPQHGRQQLCGRARAAAGQGAQLAHAAADAPQPQRHELPQALEDLHGALRPQPRLAVALPLQERHSLFQGRQRRGVRLAHAR